MDEDGDISIGRAPLGVGYLIPIEPTVRTGNFGRDKSEIANAHMCPGSLPEGLQAHRSEAARHHETVMIRYEMR
jgi:hypothetical protein